MIRNIILSLKVYSLQYKYNKATIVAAVARRDSWVSKMLIILVLNNEVTPITNRYKANTSDSNCKFFFICLFNTGLNAYTVKKARYGFN